jgi:Protein of unknown function (DUF3565)
MRPLQAQVAGIRRKIIDYHLDEASDWIADLECGHQQHVRHNPPWTNRHWVTTPQGQLDHTGHALLCSVYIPFGLNENTLVPSKSSSC